MAFIGANLVIVIKAFQDKVNELLPDVKWFFIPQSPDVSEAYKMARIAKLRQLASDIKDVPCIAWHRNPLQPDKNFDARSPRKSLYPNQEDSTTWDIYGTCYGQFSIDCLFISNDLTDMEVFEVVYNSLIFHLNQITVHFDTPVNRDFSYQCEFEPLSSIDYASERGSYSVSFSLTISGLWFLLDSSYPKLLSITNKVYLLPDRSQVRDEFEVEK